MDLSNPTRNVISLADKFYKFNSSNNVLSPETYQHSWTSTNSTRSVVGDRIVDGLHYSLKLVPTTTSSMTCSLASVIPADEDLNNKKAQFHCQMYPVRQSSVSGQQAKVTATLTNVTQSTSVSYSQELISNQWNVVFSPVIDVGNIDTSVDDIEFSISLTIEYQLTDPIYLSMPHIINEVGWSKNFFVYNMRKYLPTFIWDKDKIQEYPNYPFTKLFHSFTHSGSLAAKLYSRFYQYLNGDISVKNSNQSWRYSELMNPSYVDADYVDWLSQFNGSPLYRSVATTAGVESVGDVDTFTTWQLENAYFGRNAGTFEAIRECAKQVLTGSKVVYVFSGGSFFQINVYTLLSETPGVTSGGDTSPQVVAMLEKTRPMGFVINHESYSTLPFILDDETYGRLDEGALA